MSAEIPKTKPRVFVLVRANLRTDHIIAAYVEEADAQKEADLLNAKQDPEFPTSFFSVVPAPLL